MTVRNGLPYGWWKGDGAAWASVLGLCVLFAVIVELGLP